MTDDMTERTTDDLTPPAAALLEAGPDLSASQREAITDEGSSVLPDLITVLEAQPLWDEDAPGDGWAPIHAAEILGELGDPDALPALYRVLREVESDALLDDAVEEAIITFGEEAVRPGRAELRSWKDMFLIDLAHVFARLGVRNKSVFQVLVKFFVKDPEHGAPLLATYGDRDALDALDLVLDRYVIAASDDATHADNHCRPGPTRSRSSAAN